MVRDHWKLFVQVAELGSLTKAAALRDSAQSAVSRQLRALEQECGARLFHRTGRGVALTEAGKRIFPRVKALIEETEQLKREVGATTARPSGVVRVGLMPSIAHPLVNVLFQRTREHFPGVQLRIFDGSSGQLSEWLRNGEIDLAVLFRYGRKVNPDEYPLAEVDSYLVGPAGDELTRSSTIKFARLHNLPLVLPGAPNTMRVILDQLAKQHDVRLNILLECEALASQKDVAAEGGVYSILWLQAIARELREGRLQASRIVAPGIKRTVTLCVSKQRAANLACREVASLIRNAIHVFHDQPGTRHEKRTGGATRVRPVH